MSSSSNRKRQREDGDGFSSGGSIPAMQVSDWEAEMLGFVEEASGGIAASPPARIADVVRVLTQAKEEGQQELVLQVAGNTPDPVLVKLIEEGLLLTLKEWLRAAIDGSNADKVVLLLELLRRLPVVLTALKTSKVGVVITKLQTKSSPVLFPARPQVAALADAIYTRWVNAAAAAKPTLERKASKELLSTAAAATVRENGTGQQKGSAGSSASGEEALDAAPQLQLLENGPPQPSAPGLNSISPLDSGIGPAPLFSFTSSSTPGGSSSSGGRGVSPPPGGELFSFGSFAASAGGGAPGGSGADALGRGGTAAVSGADGDGGVFSSFASAAAAAAADGGEGGGGGGLADGGDSGGIEGDEDLDLWVEPADDGTGEVGITPEEMAGLARVRGSGVPDRYGKAPGGILRNPVLGLVGGRELVTRAGGSTPAPGAAAVPAAGEADAPPKRSARRVGIVWVDEAAAALAGEAPPPTAPASSGDPPVAAASAATAYSPALLELLREHRAAAAPPTAATPGADDEASAPSAPTPGAPAPPAPAPLSFDLAAHHSRATAARVDALIYSGLVGVKFFNREWAPARIRGGGGTGTKAGPTAAAGGSGAAPAAAAAGAASAEAAAEEDTDMGGSAASASSSTSPGEDNTAPDSGGPAPSTASADPSEQPPSTPHEAFLAAQKRERAKEHDSVGMGALLSKGGLLSAVLTRIKGGGPPGPAGQGQATPSQQQQRFPMTVGGAFLALRRAWDAPAAPAPQGLLAATAPGASSGSRGPAPLVWLPEGVAPRGGDASDAGSMVGAVGGERDLQGRRIATTFRVTYPTRDAIPLGPTALHTAWLHYSPGHVPIAMKPVPAPRAPPALPAAGPSAALAAVAAMLKAAQPPSGGGTGTGAAAVVGLAPGAAPPAPVPGVSKLSSLLTSLKRPAGTAPAAPGALAPPGPLGSGLPQVSAIPGGAPAPQAPPAPGSGTPWHQAQQLMQRQEQQLQQMHNSGGGAGGPPFPRGPMPGGGFTQQQHQHQQQMANTYGPPPSSSSIPRHGPGPAQTAHGGGYGEHGAADRRLGAPPPPNGPSSDADQRARGRPGPKGSKPCLFFNTPRGCRTGRNCPFLHDAAFVPTMEDILAISRPGVNYNNGGVLDVISGGGGGGGGSGRMEGGRGPPQEYDPSVVPPGAGSGAPGGFRPTPGNSLLQQSLFGTAVGFGGGGGMPGLTQPPAALTQLPKPPGQR